MSVDGRPCVLVVTMGDDYVAPARMPRELRAAGVRVALLAPRSAVASHTRHVDHVGLFPDAANGLVWLQTVAAAIDATGAEWILPGDDISVRLLMRVTMAPPTGLPATMEQALAALARRSLGNRDRFLDSVDKTRLVALAAEAGLAVPPGDAVSDAAEAIAVARSVGFPVVVRPAYGTASAGVAICENEAELRRAIVTLPPMQVPLPAPLKPALVQRRVRGVQCNRAAVAFDGREVAGFTRTAVRRHPGPLGPSSVASYRRVPAITEANRRLLDVLGVTGFASTLFIVDERDGTPWLIEINRRMTPATHTGRLVGVDLAAAFAAGVLGRDDAAPSDIPDDHEPMLALFPQEWLRDPASDALQRLPNDVPWDDPDLVRAFLDLARPD